uniref:hypothetical protein n=1 Tax=Vibrio neptunius TaxID=170651 RepID=UPI0030D7DE26
THIELQMVQNNVQIIVQLTVMSKKLILRCNALLTGDNARPPNFKSVPQTLKLICMKVAKR